MWEKITEPVIEKIANLKWKVNSVITKDEKDIIFDILKNNYCIILTRHNGNLTTYLIATAHLVLSKFKKFGYYSHALMNLEDEVKSPDDFRLVESTGDGVHYSTFEQVFDNQCSSVVLLKPKNLSLDEWNYVMDKAKQQVGKQYDTLFDLTSDKKLSCVELVRVALQSYENYNEDFKHFEEMIRKYKNLTPQMFYECKEFEIIYEARN